jgi:hypothetical protein
MSDTTVPSLTPAPVHSTESARALLRHGLATLAYRAGKVVRDADSTFAGFRIGPATRTPLEILAHMGDLLDWALTMAQGLTEWHNAVPQEWPDEVQRFFTALTTLDTFIAGADALEMDVLERLLRGPVADALSHTGQLALLRRLAGQPVRGESYARADIVSGRTGLDQAPRWKR